MTIEIEAGASQPQCSMTGCLKQQLFFLLLDGLLSVSCSPPVVKTSGTKSGGWPLQRRL